MTTTYTFAEFAQKTNLRLTQHLEYPIPDEVLAAQLELNGLLDKKLADTLFANKNCHIGIFPTEHGLEAVVDDKPVASPNWTWYPGFYAAREIEEVTIPQELARLVQYIEHKLIPHLEKMPAAPWRHIFKNLEMDEHKGEAILQVLSNSLSAKTEKEYWKNTIKLQLMNTYSAGKAMRAIAEAKEHYGRNEELFARSLGSRSQTEAWARQMTNYLLYAAREMLAGPGRKTVSSFKYRTPQGKFWIPDLVYLAFGNPEINKRIFAGENTIRIPVGKYLRKE